jgi:uncharacterized protein (DUF362 family)
MLLKRTWMEDARVMNATKVAVTNGFSRRNTTTRALELLDEEIRHDIDSKSSCTILIKPNMVVTNIPSAATNVETLSALLEYLEKYESRIGKIIIGEGPADGGSTKILAENGFRNYGYDRLSKEYSVEYLDLNLDSATTSTVYQVDGKEAQVRIANTALKADYRISVTVPKTHETVVFSGATKNFVLGSVIWDKTDDKVMVHGFRERREWDLHYHKAIGITNKNIARLARLLKPDLSVIDGFGAMEGEGPVDGETVNLQTVIAGTNSIAADAVASSIMGLNPSEIGYLYLADKENQGTIDLSKIQIVGSELSHIKKAVKPHPNMEEEMSWKQLLD